MTRQPEIPAADRGPSSAPASPLLDRALDRFGEKLTAALMQTLAARDLYTHDHSSRVVQLSLRLGERLGLGPRDMQVLALAASFHDIGKIGIPDRVLLKPGRLEPEEYAVMRGHPETGETILRTMDEPLIDEIAVCVRHHHERWDGGGYPDGLVHTAIPLCSRVIAVVDSYDAMISRRVYRSRRSPGDAAAVIRDQAGSQFDPRVAELFLEVLEEQRGGQGTIPGDTPGS